MGESAKTLDYTVRKADKKDAAQMMEIQLKCFDANYVGVYTTQILEYWKSALTVKVYESKIETGRCFVAEKEGAVLGYGFLNHNDRCLIPAEHGCQWQVESLYIDPSYQKKGIGKRLMVEVEKCTTQLGCRRLWILSSAYAASFYTSIGYETVCASTYEIGPGNSIDTYIMFKDI